MRFVVKSDEQRTEKLKSITTKAELLIIATTRNKALINDTVYRDSYDTVYGKRSFVEDQLAISYKNKCAYCERITKADIEHYRPKKSVTGAVHDGYYWLCYEWTNLIPSCANCNREGAKHNKFPILGIRVLHPTFLTDGNLDENANKAGQNPLMTEIPYLLHPEIDNPMNFFEFSLANNGTGIMLVGIDIDNRGNNTIDICKLNRLELTLDRVENVIDPFRESIEASFGLYINGVIDQNSFIDQILFQISVLKQQSLNIEKTHTYLREYIVRNSMNFNEIVIPFLAHGCQEIVKQAFM